MIKPFLNSSGFFLVAVGLFFLARGLLLLTVFPPLEGWDEYQHLAYIQHLVEHQSIPVLGVATVSPKLLAAVNSLPQPKPMRDYLKTQGYVEFFAGPKPTGLPSEEPKIPLYQAQHGNLYYALMAPLFSLSGGIEQPIRTINILRVVNLGLTTVGIIVFSLFAFNTFKSRMDAYLVILAAACHPLILINGCRVANDALAFALGMPVVIWALWKEAHKKTLPAVLIGALLGLAIWVKATNFFLFPFILLNLAVTVYVNALSFKRALVNGFIVFVTALLVAYQNLYFNWSHYKTIAPLNETLLNYEHGISTFAIVRRILWFKPWDFISYLFSLWTTLWMGGWSFLTSPPLVDVMMQIFCLMAVIGWGVYLAAKVVRRRSVFVDSIYPIRCLFLIFFMSLGLTWHILQSRAVYGLSYTNSWYTCLALPFTLAFAYGGMSSWGKVIAISWGWLIVSLFVMTEYYGLLAVMLPFYSGGAKWPESLDRLALLHPPWLGPPVFYFSLASSVGLLLIIVVRWYRKYQEETRNSFLRKDHASLAESH